MQWGSIVVPPSCAILGGGYFCDQVKGGVVLLGGGVPLFTGAHVLHRGAWWACETLLPLCQPRQG